MNTQQEKDMGKRNVLLFFIAVFTVLFLIYHLISFYFSTSDTLAELKYNCDVKANLSCMNGCAMSSIITKTHLNCEEICNINNALLGIQYES